MSVTSITIGADIFVVPVPENARSLVLSETAPTVFGWWQSAKILLCVCPRLWHKYDTFSECARKGGDETQRPWLC